MKYSKFKNKFFINFFLLTLFTGCISKNDERKGEKLLDFDIHPNGQSIVFSWVTSNGHSTVYQTSINGSKAIEIFHTNDNLSSCLPRYSHSGEKIVVIRRKSGFKKSSIWIADARGLKQITDSSSLIVEAVFSYDDRKLYLSRANEYGSYSPLASKAAHGFDIYLVDLLKKKPVKISNLNAYSLYNITDLNNDNMLLSLRDKRDGVFFYKKDTRSLERVVASNDTLNNSSAYANPVVVDSINIVCSSYYELVNLNTKSKTEKQVLPSTGSHFKIIRFNKQLRRIFFLKRDNSNSIFSVNIDGSDLREIPITVK